MASADKTNKKTVATLNQPDSAGTKGYWGDAWSRLVRNRLALLGLVVIILNIVLAIFAPIFAVEGIDDQKTTEAHAAPDWVINIFPVLDPRDENFPIGGELLVATGDTVKSGDLLISFNDLNASAPVDGLTFVGERRVFFAPNSVEVPQYPVAGITTAVQNGSNVKIGDVLFGETTSPVDGRVYIANDTIYIMPTTSWLADFGAPVVVSGQAVNAGDALMVNTIFTDAAGAEVSTRRFEHFVIPADATVAVEQGAVIAEGDILFNDFASPEAGLIYLNEYEIWIVPEDRTDMTMTTNAILAPVAGTALVNRGAVDLALIPLERIAIPEGAEVLVGNGDTVSPETVLFGETLAPSAGTVYLAEGELLLRRDESWLTGQGIVTVTSGQVVTAGERIIDFSPLNTYANMDGTIFINGANLILSPLPIQRFPLPADGVVSVNPNQVITEGTVLFGTTALELAPNTVIPVNSNGEAIAPTFTVFITDTELLLLPQNSGYVPLRNYYPMGADYLGRDLWSRMLYGARVSLLVALIGPLVSFIVGLPYGLVSGYFGGSLDNWLMRFVDLMYAFPTLLLIILLMAFFRSSAAATQPGTFIYTMGEIDRDTGGMFFIFLGTGLTSWMGLARLTRGLVLSAREQEYVIAAKALGQSTPQILVKHILPNILGPIVISETLSIPTYIRYEAFLSFIGLGVNAPTPSWGFMISDGAKVLRTYPHEALFPALALFLIMFAFNFLGDGLRDALDPRLRGVD